MTDNCLYVVSGYMRTGTTMMMKALEAGGMYAYYDMAGVSLEAWENYELNPMDATRWDFPRGLEGKLIKVMGGAAVSMAVMNQGIRIVYMKRDPLEIEDSLNKLFNEGKSIIPDFVAHKSSLKNYERDTDYIIERLGNRKDVLRLDVLEYSDVVRNPVVDFKILNNNGWNIDIVKAAAVVDPELYRSKVAV